MSRSAPRYRLASLRRRVRRLRFERLEIRTLLAAAAGPAISEDQAIAAALNHFAANEVGTNDFRVSDMGQDTLFDAHQPAVAYNSADDEYLVVWSADDNTGGLVNEEREIFGQRIDAATGMPLGANDFRISDMGPAGSVIYGAFRPAVVYNSENNEYLVVWDGTDDTGPLVSSEYEIFGQRLSAAGAEIGANDFRISDMGTDGSTSIAALSPAAAYNSADNEYLVVWAGDDNTGVLVNDEYEIYGQRISAGGRPLGTNDFRISQMGPDGSNLYTARAPDVAYNSRDNQYLVVWHADDDSGPLVDDEFEIYGQRLTAAGSQEGGNDFRISDMGDDGSTLFNAFDPAVAYNSVDNQYMVAWSGDNVVYAIKNDEYEIYIQRLSAAGAEVGTNDKLISSVGYYENPFYDAFAPDIAHNSAENEYLVVWWADESDQNEQYEIYGQRLTNDGGHLSPEDFPISSMGPAGDGDYDASEPALAYSSTSNEVLVVWRADDDTGPLVDNEFEIFGQRLEPGSAAAGAELRLSDMGQDVVADASDAAVAYNSINNEYLVVWRGDDVTDGDFDIFVQRIDASTGAEVGLNDVRICSMGPDGNANFGAFEPDVAYNSTYNEYLVVWRGDDNTAPLVDNEFEIFGQRLSADGTQLSPNDFRISDMGTNGSISFGAFEPAVAYNSTNNSYLVVWRGDDNSGALVNDEFEIFGQRLTADGVEVGTNDFRLSDMGPDANANFDALEPDVTYNSTDNQYLIVWRGDDDTAPLVGNELEVFGQRLGSGGVELGTNDFRISDMGADGNTAFGAFEPAVAYNSVGNEYFIVWRGDTDTGTLVNNEFEIFGQRLTNLGATTGTNDFRISDMGTNGDRNFAAFRPAVAYNSASNEYLVVWHGDDNVAPLVDNEREIFGQRISGAGAALGANDFRISDMGPSGNLGFEALNAAVAYNSTNNQWLVVWHGDDNLNFAANNEFEIFAQRFDHPAALTPLKVSAGLPTVSAGFQTVPAVGTAVPPNSSNANSPDGPSPPPVAATIDQIPPPSERLIRHVPPASSPRRPVDAVFAEWGRLGAKLTARRK